MGLGSPAIVLNQHAEAVVACACLFNEHTLLLTRRLTGQRYRYLLCAGCLCAGAQVVTQGFDLLLISVIIRRARLHDTSTTSRDRAGSS